jgi:hypothetical protein
MGKRIMAKNNLPLLTDAFQIRFLINESVDGKLRGRGEFARAGVPTANRRIYPESVWRKNLNHLQEDIRQRKVLGECDHPLDGKTKLQRVSHVITHLDIDENGSITGEIEIVEGTPNGKIVKALVDEGVTIGVSSRGYGSVKMNEDGNNVVQDDYVLMTFDVVSDPANATSWPTFSRDSRDANEESKQDNRKPIMEADPQTTTDSPAIKTLKDLDALGRVLTTDEYTRAVNAAFELIKDNSQIDHFKNAAYELNAKFPKVLHFNDKIIDALHDRVESKEKKANMSEEENKPAVESPKDAADTMTQNAAPSPDPYKEPETASQYFGVYSNQKNTWDIVTPKKIFTDKGEAQAFADKLNQDNADAPNEKAQFSVKPMEASEVLKTANESMHQTDTTWDDTHPVNFNLKDSVEEMLNSLSFWKEYSKDPKEQSRISKLMQILVNAKDQLFAESQTVEQLTTENQQLLAAAKQLGFSLFLQKSLAHHPKFEEIMSGLGNLSKFESIDQIRDLTKVHMEDADALSRQDRMMSKQSALKIEKQIDTLKEEADRIIQEKNGMIRTMEGKIQSISSELQEAKARLFLEQKLVGNPNASSIRKAWETVKPMEESKIKTFLESMQRPIDAQKPLFESVREGLKRRLPGHNSKTSSIVEDSLAGTQAPSQTEAKVPVTNQDFSEYKKLAGVK